jgi:hypothetical protein
MFGLKRSSRIVAAEPLEVEGYRFLPSVMVTTTSFEDTREGEAAESASVRCAGLRVRPVSVVEQGPEGTFWRSIPNAQVDILGAMVAMGLGTALLSVLTMWIARYVRE